MKTIVCYGDSNTWGFNPSTGERYPFDQRWTGVLAAQLAGSGFRVIEEGLCGRTTVWDDPIEGAHRNGKSYLLACMESHEPIDLVTLMLGTNDLKKRFSVSAGDIAAGAGVLVDIILKSETGPEKQAPRVLLMAPPPIAGLSKYIEFFADENGKSKQLAGFYRQVAGEYGCEFLDTGEIIGSSDLDGIHFEQEQHLKLGLVVADRICSILQEK